MRIIKGDLVAEGPLSVSETKLAATMLNTEMGEITYGDDMKLVGGHKPFPTVTVPPITEFGLARVVHCKPAVGVVFFSGIDDVYDLRVLVTRLANFFDRKSTGENKSETGEPLPLHAHLTGFHNVAATTCASVRRFVSVRRDKLRTAIHQGQNVESAKKILTTADIGRTRSMIIVPPEFSFIPPFYGNSAAFTWLFINMSAVVDLPAATMNAFNALASGIVYDCANVIKSSKSDIMMEIKEENLRLPARGDLPPAINASMWANIPQVLVLDKTNKSVTTMHTSAVHHDQFKSRWEVQKTQWSDVKEKMTLSSRERCFYCQISHSGEVYIFSDMQAGRTKLFNGVCIAACASCVRCFTSRLNEKLKFKLFVADFPFDETKKSLEKSFHNLDSGLIKFAKLGTATIKELETPGAFQVNDEYVLLVSRQMKDQSSPLKLISSSAYFIELGFSQLLEIGLPVIKINSLAIL